MANGPTIRQLGGLAAAVGRLQQQVSNNKNALPTVYAAPQNNIAQVSSSNWPSALQPIRPLGPPGSQPLEWPFWMGQNQIYTPRADAEFSAAQLRAIATYPLARICIENVKDIVCSTDWVIQLKPKPGENKKDLAKRAQGNSDLTKLSRFFERPDGQHDWLEWSRKLVEDMLVIDAASIFMARSRKGELAELWATPGEFYTRYIDDFGRTPVPPSPAYAQIWEGVPRIHLTTDQLLYKPRNIVPRNTQASFLYGFSPTEQNYKEILIGSARLEFVLNYYTAGNIPDGIQIVPLGIPPTKIQEQQKWMNSMFAGNLKRRSQLQLIQGWHEDPSKENIIFPKEKLLADAFDDLHIRKVCFGYGTSPQRLLRMMNRASSESNQEAAEEEGTKPWIDWLEGSVVNYIIQIVMGYSEIEMVMRNENEVDETVSSVVDKTYVTTAQRTINEQRVRRGEDPRPEPEADMLLCETPNGYVPLADSVKAGVAATLPKPGEPGGPPLPKPAPGAGPQPTPKPASGDNKKKVLQMRAY